MVNSRVMKNQQSNERLKALMAKMQVEPADYMTVRRGYYELFSTGKLNFKQLRIEMSSSVRI